MPTLEFGVKFDTREIDAAINRINTLLKSFESLGVGSNKTLDGILQRIGLLNRKGEIGVLNSLQQFKETAANVNTVLATLQEKASKLDKIQLRSDPEVQQSIRQLFELNRALTEAAEKLVEFSKAGKLTHVKGLGIQWQPLVDIHKGLEQIADIPRLTHEYQNAVRRLDSLRRDLKKLEYGLQRGAIQPFEYAKRSEELRTAIETQKQLVAQLKPQVKEAEQLYETWRQTLFNIVTAAPQATRIATTLTHFLTPLEAFIYKPPGAEPSPKPPTTEGTPLPAPAPERRAFAESGQRWVTSALRAFTSISDAIDRSLDSVLTVIRTNYLDKVQEFTKVGANKTAQLMETLERVATNIQEFLLDPDLLHLLESVAAGRKLPAEEIAKLKTVRDKTGKSILGDWIQFLANLEKEASAVIDEFTQEVGLERGAKPTSERERLKEELNKKRQLLKQKDAELRKSAEEFGGFPKRALVDEYFKIEKEVIELVEKLSGLTPEEQLDKGLGPLKARYEILQNRYERLREEFDRTRSRTDISDEERQRRLEKISRSISSLHPRLVQAELAYMRAREGEARGLFPVYHGTDILSTFEELDISKGTRVGTAGRAVYTATAPHTSLTYGKRLFTIALTPEELQKILDLTKLTDEQQKALHGEFLKFLEERGTPIPESFRVPKNFLLGITRYHDELKDLWREFMLAKGYIGMKYPSAWDSATFPGVPSEAAWSIPIYSEEVIRRARPVISSFKSILKVAQEAGISAAIQEAVEAGKTDEEIIQMLQEHAKASGVSISSRLTGERAPILGAGIKDIIKAMRAIYTEIPVEEIYPEYTRKPISPAEEFQRLSKLIAQEQALASAIETRRKQMEASISTTRASASELADYQSELEFAIDAQRRHIASMYTPELQTRAREIESLREKIRAEQTVVGQLWRQSEGGDIEPLRARLRVLDEWRGKLNVLEKQYETLTEPIRKQREVLSLLEREYERVGRRLVQLARPEGERVEAFDDSALQQRLNQIREEIERQKQIYEFMRTQGAVRLPPAEAVGREINVFTKKVYQQISEEVSFEDLLLTDPLRYAQEMGRMVSENFRQSFTEVFPELRDEFEQLQQVEQETGSATEILVRKQTQLLTELPFAQFTAQIRNLMSLLAGVAETPVHQLTSLVQLLEQFEREAVRAPQALTQFGTKAHDVISHLEPATREVMGYISKDVSEAISEATLNMSRFMDATAKIEPTRFPEARAELISLFEELRKFSVADVVSQLDAISLKAAEAFADPSQLQEFSKELLKVSTTLELAGERASKVESRAKALASQFDPRTALRYLAALREVWQMPGELPISILNKAEQAFKAFTSHTPELNEIYRSWTLVADAVRKYHEAISDSAVITEKVEVGTTFEGQPMYRTRTVPKPPLTPGRLEMLKEEVEASFQAFSFGWGAVAEPMKVVNSIRQLAQTFAYLGGNLEDVGINATGIIDTLREMASLTDLALRGQLSDDAAIRFERLARKVREATLVFRTEHLPALEAVSNAYSTIENAERRLFASMPKHPRLGQTLTSELLERAGVRTAAEPIVPGFTLEEALSGEIEEVAGVKISPLERVLRKVNDAIGFIEEFRILGDQWKPTASEALFPGRLNLIRSGLDSLRRITEGFIPYITEVLSEGRFGEIAAYKPTITTTIPKTLEKIKIAREFLSQEQTPEVASTLTALNLVSSKLEFIKRAFEAIDQAMVLGKVSGEDLGKTIERLGSVYARGVEREYRNLIETQRQFLKGPYAAEAISELLKLPVGPGGVGGIIDALRGITAEGKPFIETLSPVQLYRIQGGLSQALTQTNEIADASVADLIRRRIGEVLPLISARIRSLSKTGQLPEKELADLAIEVQTLQDKFYGQLYKKTPKGTLEAPSRHEALASAPDWTTPLEAAALEKEKQRIQDLLTAAKEFPLASLEYLTKKLQRELRAAQKDLAKIVSGPEEAQDDTKVRTLNARIEMLKGALKSAEELKRAPRKDVSAETTRGINQAIDEILGAQEDIVGAEAKIPAEIDRLTTEKDKALKRQKSNIEDNIEKILAILSGGEKQIRKELSPLLPSGFTTEEAMEDLWKVEKDEKGTRLVKELGDEKRVIDVLRSVQLAKNYFAEIGQQIETFGYAISGRGKPLEILSTSLLAIQKSARAVINEFSRTSEVTPFFDQLVEAYNLTAAPGQTVRTFSDMQKSLREAHLNASKLVNDAAELTKNAARTADYEQKIAKIKEQIVYWQKQIVLLTNEMEDALRKVVTQDVLREDALRRQKARIQEIGDTYRLSLAAALTGTDLERLAPLEPLQEGFEAFRRSLTAAAFKSTERNQEARTSLFAYGAPLATIADIRTKFLRDLETFNRAYGENIAELLQSTQLFNEAFGFNVETPQELAFILEQLRKVRENLATATNPSLLQSEQRLIQLLKQQTGPAYEYVVNVLKKFQSEQQRLLELKYGVALEREMQQGIDAISQFELRLDHLQRVVRAVRQGEHPFQFRYGESGEVLERLPARATRQARMHLYAQVKSELDQISKFIAQMMGEFHLPPDILKQLAAIQERVYLLYREVKGTLSLWERLTNTVKTARNDFSDLFLYQVRWYTSMLIFWGIFNRITELFSNVMAAQHEIERASINLREYSGQIVANYERLELISRIAIFSAMMRWGIDARQAAEALYQLGSAGLSARESLVALMPVTALVVGTQAEMQETVKTVAGLYNVLSGAQFEAAEGTRGYSRALESAAVQAARFREITDVLAMIFRDHQVEMYELNLGYQYSIAAADMAGLTFTELSAILAVLNDNMLKGSKAGRAVNDVIAGLAKHPYDVIASFRQMALSLSLTEERMRQVQEIVNSWDYSRMQQMTPFEVLREFARLIQVTGLDVATLGRVLENFGIVGGRAMAPMLKYWEDIEREQFRLATSASGTAEVMAERISNTMRANLGKIAAYVQATFYSVFIAIHTLTAGALSALARIGTAVTETSASMRRSIEGGEPFKSMRSFSGMALESFINWVPVLTTIATLFAWWGGQLGSYFPRILSSLVSGFVAVTGASTGLLVTLQRLAAASSLWAGLGGAFALAAGFALVTSAIRVLTQSTDEFIQGSERAWSEYSTDVARHIQKLSEVIHYSGRLYRSYTDAHKELLRASQSPESTPVSEDALESLKKYQVALGRSREETSKKIATVREFKAEMQRLQPIYDQALQQLQQEIATLSNATLSWEKYRRAREEARRAQVAIEKEVEILQERLERGRPVYGFTESGEPPATYTPLSEKEKRSLQVQIESRLAEARRAALSEQASVRERFATALWGELLKIDPKILQQIQEAVQGQDVTTLRKFLREQYNALIQGIERSPEKMDILGEILYPEIPDIQRRRELLMQVLRDADIFSRDFLPLIEKQLGVRLGEDVTQKEIRERHEKRMQILQERIEFLNKERDLVTKEIQKLDKEGAGDVGRVKSLQTRREEIDRAIAELIQERLKAEREWELKSYLPGKPSTRLIEELWTWKIKNEDMQRILKAQDDEIRKVDEIRDVFNRKWENFMNRLRTQTFESTVRRDSAMYREQGRETARALFESLKPAVDLDTFSKYLETIQFEAQRRGLGPNFVRAVLAMIKNESNFVANALSPKGAMGIAQFMPGTAAEFGVNPWDPISSIAGMINYLMKYGEKAQIDWHLLESGTKEQQAEIIARMSAIYNMNPLVAAAKIRMGQMPQVKETLAFINKNQQDYFRLLGASLDQIDPSSSVEDFERQLREFYNQALWWAYGPIKRPDLAREFIKRIMQDFREDLPKLAHLRNTETFKLIKELGIKLGISPTEIFQFTWGPIESLLRSGVPLPRDVIFKFFRDFNEQLDRSGKALIAETERRKFAQEAIRSYFEIEEWWRPESIKTMFRVVTDIAEAAGLSGRKIYDSMVQVFNTDALRKILEGNIELTADYFRIFEEQAKKWLGGRIPIRMYETFEDAIKNILTAGEQIPESRLRGLVEVLRAIPTVRLQEASQAIAKYFLTLSERKFDFGAQDIQLAIDLMRKLGASAEEMWRVIGEAAENRIRAIRAAWTPVGRGIVEDTRDVQKAFEAMWWAAVRGLADFASKMRSPLKQLSDTVSGILEAMRSAVEEALYDLALRQSKSIQEYINKFAQDLARMAARNISEILFGALSQVLLGKLGFLPSQQKSPIAAQQAAEALGEKSAAQTYRVQDVQLSVQRNTLLRQILAVLSGKRTDLFPKPTTPGQPGIGEEGEGEQFEYPPDFNPTEAGYGGWPLGGMEEEGRGVVESPTTSWDWLGNLGQNLTTLSSAGPGVAGVISPLNSLWNSLTQLGSGNIGAAIMSFIQFLMQLIMTLVRLPSMLPGLGSLFGAPSGMQSGGLVGAGVAKFQAGGSALLPLLGPFMLLMNLVMMIFGLLFGGGGGKKTTSQEVYRWQPGTPYLGPQMTAEEASKYVSKKYQLGGIVGGVGRGDIIPALLEPGEFVVNRTTVEAFGPEFFYGLQLLTRSGYSNTIVALNRAMQNLRTFGSRIPFQAGGLVPPIKSTGEMKITVVNVLDEKSLEQFLNTKRYGNVIVNRVAPRITRRSIGGFSL
ncbi:MAG: phage tail tape measure protein [Candidatus Methanomethylicaceae archaeon]